jgi:hypothetical protein
MTMDNVQKYNECIFLEDCKFFKTTVSQTSKCKGYSKSALLPLCAIYWSIQKMSTKKYTIIEYV